MNRQKIITSMILSCVLAGTSLSTANAQVLRSFAGKSRYDTALKIISNGWTKSDSAVISSGNNGNLVDALTAAPLARKLKAPIFLTDGKTLDSTTISKLKSLGVKNAYITSGTAVISSNIEKQLNSIDITYVKRLGGATRYETSVNIAKTLGNAQSIMVARGDEYADALSAAAIAASEGMPVLLSDKNTLPKSVSDYIKSQNISTSYVLGMQGALSDNVANNLPGPKRLGGKNRYETNVEIVREFQDEIDFNKLYVASGEKANLVDALAGSPLASLSSSAIILSSSALPDETAEYLNTVLNSNSNISIFGGLGAVPSAVSDKLNEIQKNLVIKTGTCKGSVKTIINSVLKTINITSVPDSSCVQYRVAGSGSNVNIGTPTTLITLDDNLKVYLYSCDGELIAYGTMNVKTDGDSNTFNVRFIK
jgi:putative cell wall-binding protein